MNDETASMLTATGTVVGPCPTCRRSRLRECQLDARSDVFSFGSVLYEILSGKRPFQARSQAAPLSAKLRDDPKPLGEVRPDIPPELRRIVTHCLKRDPQSRYPSVTELAVELKDCRELLFPESGAILTPARIAREVKRPRILIPLALVLIALLTVGVFRVKRSRNIHWAKEVAMPQISSFYHQGKYEEAYALAEKAEKAIPNLSQTLAAHFLSGLDR